VCGAALQTFALPAAPTRGVPWVGCYVSPLSRSGVVAHWVPAAFFLLTGLVLLVLFSPLGLLYGLAQALDWFGVRYYWQLWLFFGVLWALIALVFPMWSMWLFRFYQSPRPRWLARWLQQRQQARWLRWQQEQSEALSLWRRGHPDAKAIAEAVDKFERARARLSGFPKYPAGVAATSGGNLTRMLQGYLSSRYGMDGAFWWPRLEPVLSPARRKQIQYAAAAMWKNMGYFFATLFFGVVMALVGVLSALGVILQRRMFWEDSDYLLTSTHAVGGWAWVKTLPWHLLNHS